MLEEERELFELADKDKNESLTLEEYARVLQPQEFPEMQKLIVTHALKRRDTDKDGEASFTCTSECSPPPNAVVFCSKVSLICL